MNQIPFIETKVANPRLVGRWPAALREEGMQENFIALLVSVFFAMPLINRPGLRGGQIPEQDSKHRGLTRPKFS
jgi:hypothetical protein